LKFATRRARFRAPLHKLSLPRVTLARETAEIVAIAVVVKVATVETGATAGIVENEASGVNARKLSGPSVPNGNDPRCRRLPTC